MLNPQHEREYDRALGIDFLGSMRIEREHAKAMTKWRARRAVADAAKAVKDAATVLPECAGFVGTGQRCESCRIRKALHA